MTITAKFSSICPDCSQRIQVGAQVEWSRGQKARHTVCPSNARPTIAEARLDFDAQAARARRAATDSDDRSYEAWLTFQARADDRYLPGNVGAHDLLDVADEPVDVACDQCQGFHNAPACRGPQPLRAPVPIVTREAAVDAWLAAKGYGRTSRQEEVA